MSAKEPKRSLTDALGQEPPTYYANRCSVGRVMETLAPDERAAYATVLDRISENLYNKTYNTSGVTAKWLEQTLAQFGIRLSERMIRRHCRKECSCDPR